MRIPAARAFARVDMDGYIGKRGHGMEKIMPDRFCDAMAFAGGHLTIDRNMQLGALAMSHPADRRAVDIYHPVHV